MTEPDSNKFIEDVQLMPHQQYNDTKSGPVIRYKVFDFDPTVESNPRLAIPAIYMRIGDSPWICAKLVVSGIEATTKRHLNG